MIDDKQTCDVCGEEFNEERPHHIHQEKKAHAVGDEEVKEEAAGDAEDQA